LSFEPVAGPGRSALDIDGLVTGMLGDLHSGRPIPAPPPERKKKEKESGPDDIHF
jgi:hypothetical protein